MEEPRVTRVLAVLRERVAPANRLQVVHGISSWTAGFKWAAGATAAAIEKAEQELQRDLPSDYRALLQVHDGMTLYLDIEYGQWGFWLYGTQEMAEKNRLWSKSMGGKWRPEFLCFGECLGDANPLVFDTSRPAPDGSSYAVLEGNAFDEPGDWPRASRSFQEFLEHLVTAQGDKYWYWRWF